MIPPPPTPPLLDAEGLNPPSPVPLLATKLAAPPPRPHRLRRPRLTARIHPGDPVRLTLVVAPPGFGKSTLLSEWQAETEGDGHRVAWVSLDAGDNDPVRFLHYVLAALDGAHPGLAAPARTLLGSSQPPPHETVLTTLLNGLSALTRRVTLVLDDYHLIDARPVHEAVEFLLQHMPPALHLVLASRADPPLHLSRLRVRGQLSEIRAADLRFTVEEAAEFLRTAMGLNLTVETVRKLEARTEGWVAGLQLAALTLRGRDDPEEFVRSFTGSHRYIVDYLADEVLENQPPALREFMLKTSILDRMNAPLAEAVVGEPAGQATLEGMEASNLFLIPLDERREWYRYHHLFGDVLRTRLRQEHPDLVETLHARAADWLEKTGMVEEAVSHALAAKEWDRAARLIEREGDLLWRRGEQHTLDGWLNALPEDVAKSRPPLIVFMGRSYLYNGRFHEVSPLLDTVDTEGLQETEEGRDIYGRLLVIRAHVARALEDDSVSVRFSEEALANLSPESVVWRSGVSLNLALIHSQNGDLEPCVAALKETVRAGREVGEVHLTLLAMNFLGQMGEQAGTLRGAEKIYREILEYAGKRGIEGTPETAMAHGGLGRVYYAMNRIDDALRELEAGTRSRNPEFTVFSHLTLIRVHTLRRDREALQRTLSALEGIVKAITVPYFGEVMGPLRASLDVRSEEARKWASTFIGMSLEEVKRAFKEPISREFASLTCARIHLMQGDADGTIRFASGSVEAIERQKRYGSAMEYRVLLAQSYLMKGREDHALEAIRPALDLSEREGNLRAFLDAGAPIANLLRRAAAEGAHPEHVGTLLRLFREEGNAPAQSTSASPASPAPMAEPLSDREIEVLRLVAAGMSNQEIADQLFLTVGTIKRHLYNIYTKLGAKSRTDALTRAREYRLLE